jgi:thioredoxin-like negative regulator of GroEL
MDKRSLTSAENGRKYGGRPKGEATILREKAKDYLARRVEEEIEPIADNLIEKAKTGDVPAIKELFDRAWGKSKETSDVNVTMAKPIYDGKSVQGYESDQEDIPTE